MESAWHLYGESRGLGRRKTERRVDDGYASCVREEAHEIAEVIRGDENVPKLELVE